MAKTRFVPSIHGMRFPNSFSVSFRIPGLPTTPPVTYGLCGGISATANDFFRRNRTPPKTTDAPARDTPFYEYLFKRQMDTFGPAAILALRFQLWMSWKAGGLSGYRRRTFTEYEKIRKELRTGVPVVIGLVYARAVTQGRVWHNHQVLAYDYEYANGSLTMKVCDPNYIGRDDITVRAERVVIRSAVGNRYGFRSALMEGSRVAKDMRGFFMMDNRLGDLKF